MQPRGHYKQHSARRRPVSTLTIRAAFEMAEFELRREADIYAMAPTAAAQERAAQLHARANELRLRRELLP
jgi:hypothetical protein